VEKECGPCVIKDGRSRTGRSCFSCTRACRRERQASNECSTTTCAVSASTLVRRFASFGVLKGFLRRVHHWPILLTDQAQPTKEITTTLHPSPIGPRKRARSLTVPPLASSSPMRTRRRTFDAMPFATVSAHSTSGTVSLPPAQPRRRSARYVHARRARRAALGPCARAMQPRCWHCCSRSGSH